MTHNYLFEDSRFSLRQLLVAVRHVTCPTPLKSEESSLSRYRIQKLKILEPIKNFFSSRVRSVSERTNIKLPLALARGLELAHAFGELHARACACARVRSAEEVSVQVDCISKMAEVAVDGGAGGATDSSLSEVVSKVSRCEALRGHEQGRSCPSFQL